MGRCTPGPAPEKPRFCGSPGKPVIRDTRIPVETILRKMAEGASAADLLDAYPSLTAEDLLAAIAYAADAADAVGGERTIALASATE